MPTATTTSRAEDIKRWMALEREIKGKSIRYQEEKLSRAEAMREDDLKRITEVFDLFDYDKHKYLPLGDLPMILKAIGCDHVACERQLTNLPADAQNFTLEQLLPEALQALEEGRDGVSEVSAKAAFFRFCTRSHRYNRETVNGGTNNVGGSSTNTGGPSPAAADDNNTANKNHSTTADPYTANENGMLVLDAQGLKEAFLHCGARVSDEEMIELVQYADLDGDGVIGLNDWMEVMKFVTETQ